MATVFLGSGRQTGGKAHADRQTGTVSGNSASDPEPFEGSSAPASGSAGGPRDGGPSGGGHRVSLVHHRDFVRLWIGDTASQLGFALGSLAIPYLAVTALGATEFQMGLLGTLESIGFLIIGLPAGAIVDRRRKRTVMMTADLGRALLLLSLPIAWWSGLLTFGQVLLVATAVGILTVFFDVSYQSYLPFLVEREQLVEGNAKLQASQSVSQAAGPAVGGLLIKAIGPALVLTVNVAGYLASALALSRIRHRETPSVPDNRRRLGTEINEGLSFVVRHPLLRRLVACTGIANLGSSIGGVLMVLYMVRDLQFSALLVGVVESAGAIGGLLGAVLATPLARRLGEGPAIIVTTVAMLILSFVNPLSSVLPPVPTLVVGGAALGAAIVAYNIATVSFRQRLCPPELLGRMNASVRFLVWGAIPIGSFLGGVLGTSIGVVPTLWVGAAVSSLAAIPVLFSPLWHMATLPDHDLPDHDLPDHDLPDHDLPDHHDADPAIGAG